VAAGLPAERRALSADPTHPVVSAGAIFWGLGAAALDLIQSTFFATATYASRGACLERQTPGQFRSFDNNAYIVQSSKKLIQFERFSMR
jgi:hypothetical protein